MNPSRGRTIALLLALAGLATSARSQDEDPRFSDGAAAAAGQRRKRIEREIRSLKDYAWAGSYYAGDGLGFNVSLLLAPKGGYVFEWHGCLGLYDRNYGNVEAGERVLHLGFAFPNGAQGFRGIAPDLMPVRWGDRHYLVAADHVAEFCNEVNAGVEPRKESHGSTLLREADEKKPARGRPELPDDLAGCLLNRPIDARIIGLGNTNSRDMLWGEPMRTSVVTLDAGSAEGVRVGMAFHVVEGGAGYQTATVIRVDEHAGEATVRATRPGRGAPRPWPARRRPRPASPV